MARYRVGFENDAIRSAATNRNPGFFPVVDTNTQFAFGVVVALVDNRALADKITDLLNSSEK